MRTLLFALVAGCATTPPASLSTPPPSLEAVCPTTPPTGYRVERAEASHPDRAVALASARESATEQLLARLCGGISPARCAELGREIRPWKDGYHDPKTGFACASVAVDQNVLDGVETDRAALERQLSELAAAIGGAIGETPLELASPTWADGCPAEVVGSKLQALLTNALAQHAVQLAGTDRGARLALTLTPGKGVITLNATLDRDGSESVLPGLTTTPDAIPVTADTRLGCAPPPPPEAEGRDAADRDAVLGWLTDVLTECEARLGNGAPGIREWWVRFKVEEGQPRGITTSPGVDSPAPQPTIFSVGNCLREAVKNEVWVGGPTVFKATVVSELPAAARVPVPRAPDPGDLVSVVLRNTGSSWGDVRIDGAVAAEFRNHDEIIVSVSPGLHQIELLPFMNDTPVYVGRFDTAGRDSVVLGLDVDGAVVTAFDGQGLEPVTPGRGSAP